MWDRTYALRLMQCTGDTSRGTSWLTPRNLRTLTIAFTNVFAAFPTYDYLHNPPYYMAYSPSSTMEWKLTTFH